MSAGMSRTRSCDDSGQFADGPGSPIAAGGNRSRQLVLRFDFAVSFSRRDKVKKASRIACLFVVVGLAVAADLARPGNTIRADQDGQVIGVPPKKYENSPSPLPAKL